MVAHERDPLLPEHRATSEPAPADKDKERSSFSQLVSIVVVLLGKSFEVELGTKFDCLSVQAFS